MTTPTGQVICASDSPHYDDAQALAVALDFEMLAELPPPDQRAELCVHQAEQWRIEFATSGLALTMSFEQPELLRRLPPNNLNREHVVRAVLGRQLKANNVNVLDATAGMGRDALLLAAAGCDVIMVEKNPLLFFMLERSIADAKAAARDELCDAVSRMQIYHADSLDFMRSREVARPEVVYLDPMFETGKGSAAVKKNMAFLQRLLGNESDRDSYTELLEAALAFATRRVVVKRAPSGARIGGREPAYSLKSKAIRFDVYLA